MTDPVIIAARAAARRLAVEAGPGLVAEVEAALADRNSRLELPQYIDPVSLGGLIVSSATLAWTVYSGLKKDARKPSADLVARIVRIRLGDSGHAASEHVVEVVVSEAIRTAQTREQSQD
jgi:hypothetical protein